MSCPTLSTIIDFIHRTLGPDTNDTDATPLSPYLIPVSLKFKTIPERPTKKHTATVIFLHGLGDSSDGIFRYVMQMSLDPALGHVKWIIPDAPRRPVTGHGGMLSPSWFDVLGFDIFTRAEDEPSLLAAASSINSLLTTEIHEHEILPERIVVGGLSQGGALACLVALTSERKLGGAFVLSAYVPLWRKTNEIATPIAPSIPIFWGHGTNDSQVNHDKAFEAASDLARKLDIPIRMVVDKVTVGEMLPLGPMDRGIRFHSYKGLVHWIDEVNELDDLTAWIQGVVP